MAGLFGESGVRGSGEGEESGFVAPCIDRFRWRRVAFGQILAVPEFRNLGVVRPRALFGVGLCETRERVVVAEVGRGVEVAEEVGGVEDGELEVVAVCEGGRGGGGC